MNYESFTLLLDYSQPNVDAPQWVDEIMKKSRYQPSLLAEEKYAYQWPDTLELRFSEMTTEEGVPPIIKHELIRPVSSYPLPPEDIDRSIIDNFETKSKYIPTLFFTYEGVVLTKVGNEVYVMQSNEPGYEELRRRIDNRNAMVGFQTPALEIAKIAKLRDERNRVKMLKVTANRRRIELTKAKTVKDLQTDYHYKSAQGVTKVLRKMEERGEIANAGAKEFVGEELDKIEARLSANPRKSRGREREKPT